MVVLVGPTVVVLHNSGCPLEDAEEKEGVTPPPGGPQQPWLTECEVQKARNVAKQVKRRSLLVFISSYP
jgi:hypothetical protein